MAQTRGRTPIRFEDVDAGESSTPSTAEGIMSSIYNMPNTPGIRPNHLSMLNKSLAAKKVIAERAFGTSRPGTSLSQMSRGFGNDHHGMGASRPTTAMSYYEDPEFFNSLAESLNPYPSTAHVPSDLSGRYSLRSQQEDRRRNTRALPFASLHEVPSFVVSGETVCRFFAYVVQVLADNNREPERLRKVEILMYQSDMTLEIKEVKVASGGLVPITLKRHQVMKPITDGIYDNEPYYTIYDCTAGSVLNIYNSYYTLVDCDGFTRRHMNEMGLDFGESLPYPSIGYNPNASWKSVVDTINEARMHAQRESQEKAMKFFEFNTQVLRFFGVWQDRAGNQNTVKIHYFLSDDTIEVVTLYGKNDGRDHVPKFLKRMKIRKPASDEMDVKPGGSLLLASTFEDPLDITIPPYYSWTDFAIGSTIRFAGIRILISDADEFTRQFYRNNGTPLASAVQSSEPVKRKYSIRIPPHNGIGSEEDSLQTCKGSLLPKAPKRDGAKAEMFAGQVLRFKCRFAGSNGSDRDREFVIQAFLEDDTIQIQELAVRNSGFMGGKFLARGRQKAPDGSRLMPHDLFIGGIVKVRCHAFEILDADERTIKHMEKNCNLWPQSNLNSLKHRMQIAGDAIQEQVQAKGDVAVGYSAIKEILNKAGINLTPQESITLFRDFDPKSTGFIRTSALLV